MKDSEPVGALIPIEEYESMLETLDILGTEPDRAPLGEKFVLRK